MYISIEVPDITDYPKGFPQYWLKALFVRSVSTDYQVRALAGTYVRLIEAAFVEYRIGAAKLREFWDTHDSFNLGAMNRSIAHFESCLSDMHRAVNCYRRLRRHRGQDPLSLALNNERPSFAADSVADQLRFMRDEIHHLDEMLGKWRTTGRPADGPPTRRPRAATSHRAEPDDQVDRSPDHWWQRVALC
jgi:hypothetical protein